MEDPFVRASLKWTQSEPSRVVRGPTAELNGSSFTPSPAPDPTRTLPLTRMHQDRFDLHGRLIHPSRDSIVNGIVQLILTFPFFKSFQPSKSKSNSTVASLSSSSSFSFSKSPSTASDVRDRIHSAVLAASASFVNTLLAGPNYTPTEGTGTRPREGRRKVEIEFGVVLDASSPAVQCCNELFNHEMEHISLHDMASHKR